MIKRRFYRYEHGDKDTPSGESSSSDSEVEADARDEAEDDGEEEDNAVAEVGEDAVAEVGEEEANSSSGYESEDSSANEVKLDSPGLPTSDDDVDSQNAEKSIVESLPRRKGKPALAKTQNIPGKDEIRFKETDYVLKCKSVFKCRICPRIVCLSEETTMAHLKSKRHARSEKLLREGRLMLMLNEKGQIEGETLPEEESDSEQELAKSKRKNKGRLKQKKRLKQEKGLKKAASSALAMNRRERRRNDQLK